MTPASPNATPVHLSEAKRKLLERYLRGELVSPTVNSGRIERRPSDRPIPLAWAQEQVLRRARETVGKPALYSESITLIRKGPLNVSILERCLTEIVRRHEIWRTGYDTFCGEPVQIIYPAPHPIPLTTVNLENLPREQREFETTRLASEEAAQPFHLASGPLIRATLIRFDEWEHRLYLTMHQSVVDGISVFKIFPAELTALYSAYSEGRNSPLPELQLQYADYAFWQRQWLRGEVLENQVTYWRQQLKGALPALPWPNDFPRPAEQTYRGAIFPFEMGLDLSESLKSVCHQQECTLFAALLAGFTSVLYRYTGQEDILIGTLSPAGRKRSEVEGLLGYFLNLVALRMRPAGNVAFAELLCQAREVISGALSNDDVPLEYLVEELKIPQEPSRHPLFQVAVSLAPPLPELEEGWKQSFMDVESGGARWDLYIEFNERPTGLMGRAQYNPDLFTLETLETLLEDMKSLLASAVVNPQQALLSLPIPRQPNCPSAAVESREL